MNHLVCLLKQQNWLKVGKFNSKSQKRNSKENLKREENNVTTEISHNGEIKKLINKQNL